ILLVEDNVHNQILATTYLERKGAVIDVADNGQIGIEKLQKNTFDIILMDLQMPIMDGFTATQKIRETLNSNIPIIGCSAHSLVGEKEKCLDVGMKDYVAKPYTENELVNTVLKYRPDQKQQKRKSEVILSDIVFDDFESLLNDLRNKEGDDFVKKVTGHFVERTPKDISEIETAIKDGDMHLLGQKAHLIIGSLGLFDFEKGLKLSKDIEYYAKKGDSQKAIQLGNELISYLNKIMETMI
ncbi:MAG: response regulator, partial [Bacteroidota bacterium]